MVKSFEPKLEGSHFKNEQHFRLEFTMRREC